MLIPIRFQVWSLIRQVIVCSVPPLMDIGILNRIDFSIVASGSVIVEIAYSQSDYHRKAFQCTQPCMPFDCSVCASFSPNDRYVILSCTENTLCLWCLEHNTIERVFKGNHQIAKHLCSCSFYVYQKQYIVTGSGIQGMIVVISRRRVYLLV